MVARKPPDRSVRSTKRVNVSGQKFGDRIVLRIENKWFVKKWQDADGNELEKPWLANLPTLSQMKLEVLQQNFPMDASTYNGGLLASLQGD